jgi:hypothetical protein
MENPIKTLPAILVILTFYAVAKKKEACAYWGLLTMFAVLFGEWDNVKNVKWAPLTLVAVLALATDLYFMLFTNLLEQGYCYCVPLFMLGIEHCKHVRRAIQRLVLMMTLNVSYTAGEVCRFLCDLLCFLVIMSIPLFFGSYGPRSCLLIGLVNNSIVLPQPVAHNANLQFSTWQEKWRWNLDCCWIVFCNLCFDSSDCDLLTCAPFRQSWPRLPGKANLKDVGLAGMLYFGIVEVHCLMLYFWFKASFVAVLGYLVLSLLWILSLVAALSTFIWHTNSYLFSVTRLEAACIRLALFRVFSDTRKLPADLALVINGYLM